MKTKIKHELSLTTWLILSISFVTNLSSLNANAFFKNAAADTVIWAGTNTQCSNAGNWSNGTPCSTADVKIPAGLAHYPTLGSGETMVAKSITIAKGASLTLSDATSTLSVKGNFKNDGDFNSNRSTVSFDGTSIQYISGSSKTAFDNIVVTNTASPVSVSVESNQNLFGVLQLSANAVFDADGSNGTSDFALISNSDVPTADANIGPLPSGAQVIGKVTALRYMSKSGVADYQYQVWRNISAPVNTTVLDLQNSLPVTGPFTNHSILTANGVADPYVDYSYSSMFSYNEGATSDNSGDGLVNLDDGWTQFPAPTGNSASTYFNRGQGYSIFIFGSNDPVLNSDVASWALKGPIWSGSFNMPVTYSVRDASDANNNGWNLIGNPYPSTIDWDSPNWTKVNLDGAVYFDDYRTANPVVASYNNGVSTNGGTNLIAMGQGFWVKAVDTPTLTITEGVKAAGQSTTFFRTAPPANMIRVTLSDGTESDETVVYFSNSSTGGFDKNYDARKFRNPYWYLNLSSLSSENEKYAINAQPFSNCSHSVALDVSDVSSGTYSLSFSEFESFYKDMSIKLKDNHTNTVIDVRQNQNYSFAVDGDEAATYGSDRFSLVFDYIAPAATISAQSPAVCDSTQAKITISNTSTDYTYSILSSVDGSVFLSSINGIGSDITIALPGSLITEGTNQFVIEGVNAFCSSITSKTNVAVTYAAKPSAPIANPTSICGQGSVALSASGVPTGGHYNWYESADATTVLTTQSALFTTPVLSKNTTYYVSTSNALGCEGSKTAVSATVINLEPASIAVTDTQTLESNYESGNQWYLNDQLINGASGKSLNVTQSGVYKLVVSSQGCTVSVEKTFVVMTSQPIPTPTPTPTPDPTPVPAPVPVPDSVAIPTSPVDTVVTNPSPAELTITGVEPASISISAYPNPVKETLTIETSGENKANALLFNAMGENLSQLSFTNEGQKQFARYNFDKEASGVYFIRVIQEGQVTVVRVVKD